MSEPKYRTLGELKSAYDSGELSREEHPLILDNDCTFVYVDGECVYRTDYYGVEDALDLLDIPWEHC